MTAIKTTEIEWKITHRLKLGWMNEDDLDDLRQLARIAIAEAGERWEAQGMTGDVNAYVYRCAYFYVCDNLWQAGARRRPLAKAMQEDPALANWQEDYAYLATGDDADVEAFVAKVEQHQRMLVALARLPERDAAIVRAVYLDEQPVTEVSAEHQCSRRHVYAVIDRSLAAMRRYLAR